jgi:hypothetical protein
MQSVNTEVNLADLLETIETYHPMLAVIDGTTETMTTHGLETHVQQGHGVVRRDVATPNRPQWTGNRMPRPCGERPRCTIHFGVARSDMRWRQGTFTDPDLQGPTRPVA